MKSIIKMKREISESNLFIKFSSKEMLFWGKKKVHKNLKGIKN